MRIFDFFKKKPIDNQKGNVQNNPPIELDRSDWTGKDFEFLIAGDVDISNEEFDEVMTPNTLTWTKTVKNGWNFYQVDEDEYAYSIEPPGIQMTFNSDIKFSKAKKIIDEVIENIVAKGQVPRLIVISSGKLAKFDGLNEE